MRRDMLLKTIAAVFLAVVLIAAAVSVRAASTVVKLTPERANALPECLATAKGGTRILLAAGVYRFDETIELSNLENVTIEGDSEVWILLSDVNKDVLAIRKCRNVVLTNIRARHVEPLDHYECHGAVLRIEDSNGVTVDSSTLDGCGAVGVHATASSNITISNSVISHNTFSAFYFDGLSEVKLMGNRIFGNGSMLNLYRTTGLIMEGNTVDSDLGYWQH